MTNITVSFINQLFQFGTTYFDVIIKDLDGLLPDKRTTVKFKHPEEAVTEQSLQLAAEKQIEIFIEEWNVLNGN